MILHRGPKALGVVTLVATAVFATAAAAQELRPAPKYFLETMFAVPMAEQLAAYCVTVDMNFVALSVQYDTVTARLAADGFDAEDPFANMVDTQVEMEALQTAFLTRHNLAGADQARVCAAAMTEISEASLIGLLLEIAPE